MVGPSITEEDRERFSRRIKVGFVLTVALSGTLVAVYAGGDGPFVAGATAVGALTGVVLLRYLMWIGGSAMGGTRRRGDR